MAVVAQRFVGALRNHLTSWSSVQDLVVAVAAMLLLRRGLPGMMSPMAAAHGQPEPTQSVALWLTVLALLAASLVSYRRANALRSEQAWTQPAQETHHCALLAGELLCSAAVALLMTLPSLLWVAIAAPAVLAPSAAALLTLLASIVLLIAMAISVFYLLSAYVLGAEGFSVFAITIVILGFARSDVPREIARTVAGVPFLAFLPDVTSIATRVFTPPLEETIKAAIAGSFAGQGLYLAQGVLQVVFLVALSLHLVHHSGALDLEGRRVARRERRASAGTSQG